MTEKIENFFCVAKWRKYYLDYSTDIEKMLQLDFGKDLIDTEINIPFYFFHYREYLSARPYVGEQKMLSK